MQFIILVFFILVNTIFLYLLVKLFNQHKDVKQKLKTLTCVLTNNEHQYLTINKQIQEIRTVAIDLGDKLVSVEHKALQDVDNLKNSVEINDPSSRLYARGAKMVALGAELEEIMRDCDLPRAEAELIVNLHKKAM